MSLPVTVSWLVAEAAGLVGRSEDAVTQLGTAGGSAPRSLPAPLALSPAGALGTAPAAAGHTGCEWHVSEPTGSRGGPASVLPGRVLGRADVPETWLR